ncbi:MAG TPA: hypothetical protein ENI87_03225 [bacterium]|nr:hypothetical protein [bacterium]
MSTRRRISDRLLLVTNLAVANGVAALWVASFLQPSVLGGSPRPGGGAAEAGGRALHLPLQTPAAWLALLGSIALLLWNFAWLVRRREHAPPSNWVISESPAGPVRIAREAIEAALRLAGEALPEVTRLRVQVDLRSPRRILVRGQFHCAEGVQHLAASQRLRAALVARFGELVHLAEQSAAEFELEFQGFAGKLDKHLQPPADEPPADEGYFRGPQYPIGDDEPDGGRRG